MNFHIVTLFPESMSSYLSESILARAQEKKLISVKFYNPRDYVKPTKAQKGKDKPYLRVDDKPYGGGPGMIMEALPILKALEAIKKKIKKGKIKIIHLSPSGEKFTTEYAKNAVKKFQHVIIICGRYEGIDARVKKIFKGDELSVGDYVLTGGELPAMIMIDCMSRQVKGVLGDFNSLEETRAASADVYTRPEVLNYKNKKHKVPEVLLSGNHKLIEEWRKQQSESQQV
ncbi:MAG: tRNA ((1)-)-methyltransferase, tRNA (guanine37-N1)-methyltransferase [Candidatus Parcubacteria bacterium]|jgi:tRNA (guanine37-N1)-methyltransferase